LKELCNEVVVRVTSNVAPKEKPLLPQQITSKRYKNLKRIFCLNSERLSANVDRLSPTEHQEITYVP